MVNRNKKQFSEIDQLFKKWNTKESPGCSLGIIKKIEKNNIKVKELLHKKTKLREPMICASLLAILANVPIADAK